MTQRYAKKRALAERHYRACVLTPLQIAKRVGLTERTIKDWARKYGWDEPEDRPWSPAAASTAADTTIRPPEPAPVEQTPPPDTAVTAPRPAGAPPVASPPAAPAPVATPPRPPLPEPAGPRPSRRITMIHRLYNAIDRNLQLLEQRMNDDRKPTAADTERGARALNTAIRNIEKVTELEADAERNTNAGGQRQPVQYTEQDTARLRLELAERILRLREEDEANEGEAGGLVSHPEPPPAR